jgi:NADH-quinone oxidoreductase subunit J
MVLFLFVVMMLDINLDKLREGFWDYLPLAGFVSVLLVIEMALILGSRHFGLGVMGTPAPHAADYSNTKELGRLLYTDYVYAFELAAVILLVAIVAAIALTLRRRKDSKYIDPAEQVKVKRNDRLRIVKMPAVKMQAVKKAEAGEGGA